MIKMIYLNSYIHLQYILAQYRKLPHAHQDFFAGMEWKESASSKKISMGMRAYDTIHYDKEIRCNYNSIMCKRNLSNGIRCSYEFKISTIVYDMKMIKQSHIKDLRMLVC